MRRIFVDIWRRNYFEMSEHNMDLPPTTPLTIKMECCTWTILVEQYYLQWWISLFLSNFEQIFTMFLKLEFLRHLRGSSSCSQPQNFENIFLFKFIRVFHKISAISSETFLNRMWLYIFLCLWITVWDFMNSSLGKFYKINTQIYFPDRLSGTERFSQTL